MRKRFVVAIALGVLGLGLVFAASQSGIGMNAQPQTPPQTPMAVQPPMPSSQAGQPQGPSKEHIQPERLQEEIALLKLINEMGLSREQLKALQQMISELLAKRRAIVQAQLELRDFLLGYQGSPDKLAEALKPYEEKVEGARRAFREALQSSVDQLKDLLTLRQGEVLRDFLRERFGLEREGQSRWSWQGWGRGPGHPRVRIWAEPRGPREGERPEWQEFQEQMRKLQEKLREWLRGWGLEFDFELPPMPKLEFEFEPELERKPGCRSWGWKPGPRPMPEMRGRKRSERLEIWICPPFAGFGLQRFERGRLERFLIERLELLNELLQAKLERLKPRQSMQI